MKRLSKLTALLLALLLVFNTCGAALAETGWTIEDYDQAVTSAQQFYDGLLACEDGYDIIDYFASMTEEEAEAYYAGLSEERRAELDAHLNGILAAMSEDDMIALAAYYGVDTAGMSHTPAKNYTAVAGLANDPVTVPSVARMFRMTRDMAPGNGLEMSKVVDDLGNGEYQITLEAYTTGQVSNSTEAVPTDIVLVLDESGSMSTAMYSYKEVYQLDTNNNYYVKVDDTYYQVSWCANRLLHRDGWYTGGHFIIHWGTRYEPKTSASDTTSGHVQFYTREETATSRRDALEKAATTFVNEVYANAVENNVDHRVAVIGFSGDGNASTKIGLVDDIRNNIGTENTRGTVLYAVNNLNANGGTYIEDGMALAETAFDNAAATNATKRNRVVVVFTDGIPGSGTWNNTTINDSANPAISTSNNLKNTYKATVYTIGMLDDANPTLDISDETDDAARTNKFLHFLSSNYPNATSMTNGGSGSNKGYYLAASDAASLTAIFQKISQEISVPTIDLGSTTEIRDIISPYFTAPANTSAISVKTYDCTAYDGENATWATEGTTITNGVTVEGDTVSVTGFDFNANYVSTLKKSDGTYGKKIVIVFTVQQKDGFLGGDGVPTNDENSGVYIEAGLIEKFEQPTVNIDVPVVTVDVSAAEKNVYLLSDLSTEQLLEGSVIKCGDVVLDPSRGDFGLEAWQTEYVDIVIAEPAEQNDLTADSTYTLGCTVTSINNAANTESGSATAKINVFMPELTFADSEIKYQAEADAATYYNATNYKGVAWKHASVTGDILGTAPVITLSYDVDANTWITGGKVSGTSDVRVNVTPKIGDADITAYTTSVRKACTTEGCITADATAAQMGNDPEFIVHIVDVYGALKIIKQVKDSTFTSGSRTFSFTVNGEPVDVVVQHNDGATAKGHALLEQMLIGDYKVVETTTENYTTTMNGQAVTELSVEVKPAETTEVTVVNTAHEDTTITVTKVWDDNSNELGERPDSVTLTVHASSEVQDQTVVLTAENAVDTNTWSDTLTVPKFDSNGQLITYTATEVVDETLARYEKNESDLTVTNSITVGDLFINKTVVDTYGIYSDTDRTFNFKITKDSENVELPVTVEAGKNSGLTQISNLEPGVYTVVELAKNGYECADSEIEVTVEAGKKASVTFTNTVKTVNIPVTKTWEDLNDEYKVRPASITVALTAKYADGTAADAKYNKSITIDATTDWKSEFQNVAIYDANGVALTYAVTETLAANAEFYTTTPNNIVVEPAEAVSTIAITNSIKLGSLTITKRVVDPSGKYADDLSFEFTVTGKHNYNEKHTVTVKKTDGYTGSVTIPQLLIGEYTVTETVPGNFTVTANDLTATVEHNATATVAFENTVKTFTLTANKTWVEVNGDKSHRPASVTYTLATGDEQFDDTVTIPAETDDTWTAEKANLPVYTEDGTPITYTASETLDEASAAFYVLDATRGYDVTATAEDATVSMTNVLKVGNLVIVKVIEDPSATYNASQEFDFTVNGVTKTVTVAAGENTGTTTFENLTIGTYAVTETVPGNYDLTSVTVGDTAIENGGEVAITYDNAPQTTTVTFTNTVKTVDIPVTKIWVDESNKLGTRPDSITLTLTGKVGETAVVTKTQQLTADNAVSGNANQWEFTFVKLPVYTVDGDLITYTVDEAPVNDYEKSVNGYVITNTLLSTTLTITKAGCDETLDAGQSFLFRVTSTNGVDLMIAINGNGSETISDLLVGDVVTVTEIEEWSWRYTGAAQTITLVDGTNAVTITNTRDNPYWLDGDCYAENNFAVQGN